MTGKEFMRAVSNGKTDLLGLFLALLEDAGAAYCVVDGLALNAYKDLADITRLVETHPILKNALPPEIRSKVE